MTAHDECGKRSHHVEEEEQSGSAFPKVLFHRSALPHKTNVERSKSYSVQIKFVFTGSSLQRPQVKTSQGAIIHNI